MHDDRYADVRRYDPTWDEWTAGMGTTEKEATAVMLRDTFGYQCWKIGVNVESIVGPPRDAMLRRLGIIPTEQREDV